MSPFPLRLAPFEEYMLRDDRRSHPMHIWCRLRFEGRAEPAALSEAFAATVARHPLLAAIVPDAAGPRPAWHPAPAAAMSAQFRWCEERLLADFGPLTPIDLSAEPACRAFASIGPESATLLLHLHHAACDGGGLFAFVSDLLVEYHARSGGESAPPDLPDRDPAALPGRSRFGLSGWRLVWQMLQLAHGLPNTIRFVTHRAAPLVADAPIPQAASDGSYQPGVVVHEMAADRLDRLRQAARQAGVTLNDLLVRDLLVALAQWRQDRVPYDPRQWLRISVPVNLRLEADRNLPAANLVSMVFIDRRGELLQQPVPLLASINRQMSRIKRYRLGLIFPLLVGVLRRLGRMASLLTAQRCRATCVLTNLGEPLAQVPLPRDTDSRIVARGLTLLGIETLAPLRPLTQVAMSVLTYAGRLQIVLHYDRRILSEGDARQLMSEFIAAGDKSAA